MSLEAKIEALTKAVEALTAAMENAPKADGGQAPSTAPAAKPEPKAKPAPKVEKEAGQEPKGGDTEQPTAEELQDLCMTIVRSDRSKRDAVKEAIGSFGGAETLKEVPEKDLGALKAKLESL